MITLQLTTAAFAIACAWLNKWPVLLMRAYWAQGSHKAQERQFHAANAAVKVLWATGHSIAYWQSHSPLRAALLFVLLLLIQWIFFDPALNIFTDKPIFYLGQTARLDKTFRNGAIKAAAVLLLIITLNFLL